MGLFELIRQLNPLRTPATTRVAEAIALELGRGRAPVLALKSQAGALADICVKRALERFEQGPSAELIMIILETSNTLWLRTARALARAPGVDRAAARRVASGLGHFAGSFTPGSDLMLQHVTNLVLAETGLGSEAMVLKPGQVNAARLSERLGELMRLALSSSVEPGLELIPVPPPSPGRFASA